jgi:adenylate cyclase
MTRALRRRMLLAVALLAAGVACLLELGGTLDRLELSTVDARFALRGERSPGDLVVVGVDDVTFQAFDNERWPFGRDRFAAALERVAADGPRVIAYDVQFTEASDDADADNRLIEAARVAGNVVFSTTEVGDAGETNVFGGAEGLAAADATAGNGLLPEDTGGVLRRVPEQVDGLDTLAVAAVKRMGRPLPKLTGKGAWIDYLGPPGHVPHVHFSDVALGKLPRGRFHDKVVVIGATAPSLQDVHPVSWPSGEMDGPEIHATAIDTLLRGAPLHASARGVNLAIAVLLALLTPLAALVARPWLGLALTLAVGAAYAVAVQLLFGAGLILPFVVPLAGLAIGFVGTLLAHWLSATFERERTRDVFARFVPDAVVDQVLARATEEGDPRLGGERMDATVMFSDLRGFTTFAEGRDPEQVIEVLNRYLTAMSDAILDHRGTLVAYMGDGIMAVFGAPVASTDHADQALAAAREMLERLDRFNAWIREGGQGEGFKMGIGLHSGTVMSGNVGSARRLEYAAIGDTTNTAARLEGMTKGTPYQLFVGESTRDRLAAPPEELEFVSELDVRGREHGIRVWGLRESQGAEVPGAPHR